jgi:hypothetical protein
VRLGHAFIDQTIFRALPASNDEKIMIFSGHGSDAEGQILEHKANEIKNDRVHFAKGTKITLCPSLLQNKPMNFVIRDARTINIPKIIFLYP